MHDGGSQGKSLQLSWIRCLPDGKALYHNIELLGRELLCLIFFVLLMLWDQLCGQSISLVSMRLFSENLG